MTFDFLDVVELGGDPASREQLQRLNRRYYWAATHSANRDVLEVGCGAGQGLGYLAGIARFVSGADFSRAVLATASRHYEGRIALSCFDAQQMPCRDASFDVVIMLEAIYYLPDASRFAQEAFRVLRPGGILLVSSANRDLSDFTPSAHSTRYYGVVELAELLQSSGFKCRFLGDTDVTRVSTRQQLLRPLKRLATAARIMPGNKRLKAALKRVMFGPILALPAEVYAGGDAGQPLEPIPSNVPDTRHKVICCEARKPE
jgi:ubiquinone/menaquinone biosynthesis C-methylase UbiE